MNVVLSSAVGEALDGSRPVVALETSVLAQGLPDPWNRRAAEAMEAAIRKEGAEPGWVWAGDGAVRVGADPRSLDFLLTGGAHKAARRDLPMAVAGHALGAATVSATLWAAHQAGIEVTATGGIGGVHPGSGDVSADLLELARTPGTLVCSGPKAILDPGATLERLEELGVGLLGYRCDLLPFFFVREVPLPLEHRADQPEAVAETARARRELGVESTLLVCNPCPQETALPSDQIEEVVTRCAERMHTDGITGKRLTPALLACLAEETGGATLKANLALLEDNARLAASVAGLLV